MSATSNPALDQHFERLHAAIASMRPPDVHVHVHMDAPAPAQSAPTSAPKPKSARAGALGKLIAQRMSSQGAPKAPSAAAHPYVS